MAKIPLIDKVETLDILRAFQRGELKSEKSRKEAIARMARLPSARGRSTKEARITLRLSAVDLEMLKLMAEHEGMAYQTLIASVLHKYVSGRLVSKGF